MMSEMLNKATPLRNRRKHLRMTQQQVANAACISRSIYSLYELGLVDPPTSKALRIARALVSTVEELFAYTLDAPAGEEG